MSDRTTTEIAIELVDIAIALARELRAERSKEKTIAVKLTDEPRHLKLPKEKTNDG